MEPFVQKEGILIPHLGLAAASFAAFLGIMTMSEPPQTAISAVENFSVGIPLTLACIFLPGINDKPNYLHIAVIYLNGWLLLLGSLFCLLGLHKCFHLVSKQAGNNFKVIAIFVFILMIASGIYEIVQLRFKKSNKVEENKEKST